MDASIIIKRTPAVNISTKEMEMSLLQPILQNDRPLFVFQNTYFDTFLLFVKMDEFLLLFISMFKTMSLVTYAEENFPSER